jgi:hypothetical protein
MNFRTWASVKKKKKRKARDSEAVGRPPVPEAQHYPQDATSITPSLMSWTSRDLGPWAWPRRHAHAHMFCW